MKAFKAEKERAWPRQGLVIKSKRAVASEFCGGGPGAPSYFGAEAGSGRVALYDFVKAEKLYG